MGLLFMIVAGAVLGWLAVVFCRIRTSRGIAMELGAGIVGALAGGALSAPLFGLASLLSGTYGVPALLLTLVGAAVLVGLLNLLRPAQLR